MKQQNLSVYFEEKSVTTEYLVYKTEFHELKINQRTLDRFEDRLAKMTKKGPRYSPEEKHGEMIEFVMSKSKPLVKKMSGDEWESSMRALIAEVFDENWDRDFDEMGQVRESVKKIVELGLTGVEIR